MLLGQAVHRALTEPQQSQELEPGIALLHSFLSTKTLAGPLLSAASSGCDLTTIRLLLQLGA